MVKGFYCDDPNDNSKADHGEDENAVDVDDEADEDHMHDGNEVDEFMYQTKAERKKERRQEKAWLGKEGQKRRKKGPPRNFLLVDERTGMPYSVGVGDWRKELILMSRDLDPAIGNINRQPEGAVAEIAEWI